jgi:hypothetical protein
MTKRQQIGPSSSLLTASAALAESKSSTPVLETVAQEFGKAIKMVEEEQQRIQDKVNDSMGDLKTDIDFTTLEPSMEKEVRSYLLEGKNEYSNLANELARLDDASDPRYQEIVDKMSNIQRGYSNLAAELASYNQNKITTAEQIRNGEFSKGTDQLGRVSSIYGLDGTKPSMSIKDGHLSFNLNGETVDYYKMKNIPGVATKVASSILDTQVELSQRGTPMTPEEKKRYARTIEDSLRNQDTLASILSDYPDELVFTDLREEFFDLRSQGKLDAEALKNIRTQVKDRVLNGYENANARGVRSAEQRARDKASRGRDGSSSNMSSSMQEKAAMWKAATSAYQNHLPFTIENVAGEKIRFADPVQTPKGEWVYTKQVFDEKLGLFEEEEAVQDFGKLGSGVKKQTPAKSTKAWTLPEIQAEFGYQF